MLNEEIITAFAVWASRNKLVPFSKFENRRAAYSFVSAPNGDCYELWLSMSMRILINVDLIESKNEDTFHLHISTSEQFLERSLDLAMSVIDTVAKRTII